MEARIQEVCSKIDELVSEDEFEDENLMSEAMSALSISDVVKDEDLE
jgi:hypothetical protein